MAADLSVATGPLFDQYQLRAGHDTDIRQHLPELHRSVIGWQFARVLELGTRSGYSASAFLAALELNGAGHLWSVDVNDPEVPAWWLDSPFWSFLKADDMSAEALAFGPPQVEVLFIDTSHEYGHTLAELRAYVPRVKPGGTVLMHDTEWRDGNLDDAGPHESEVGRALDEYCAESGLSWVNRPGCYGLGVMEIPR